jgi:hypothetical protein
VTRVVSAGALALVLVLCPLAAIRLLAQPASPPLSFNALIGQTVALFPRVEGEVVEAQGRALTVSVGRKDGAQPGLALEVFREGREIRNPRTGQLLGRAEQALGRAVIGEVFDGFSTAAYDGEAARPGDRVRTPAGKVKLTVMSLSGGGVKGNLVEAAVGELYEGLNRTGRFQLALGDQVGAWLAQQQISGEDAVQGRGIAEALARLGVENLLVLHFTQVQKKPFVEARVFSRGRQDAALQASLFVPPSVKPAAPTAGFSSSDRAGATERKQKSLLERLLGWFTDNGNYSSAETSIPLKEVARYPFTVTSLDVGVAPADKIPRVVLTDGERIYLYRLVNQAFEPEWTFYARWIGRVISVQLADLAGDGSLAVVANRFETRIGMRSLIIGTKSGKPVVLADQIDDILIAVDERGTGVKQTLWAQRYREEGFFNKGQADQMVLRDGKLVKERSAVVPDSFRATGASFASVMGKGQRALAFIDEYHRLRITNGSEEIWRSSSSVGGGGQKIEVVRYIERGGRSYFYTMEPTPLAVDLDGDGVDELVVPQNQLEGGILAVIYRGPTGLRFQQVASGFEGVVAALGAIPGDDGGTPTLIAAVLRYSSFLKTSGETQIIMTTTE